MAIDENTRISPIIKIIYFNNLAAYYIYCKQYEKGQSLLDKAYDIIKTSKIRAKHKAEMMNYLQLNQANIHLHHRKLDGIEEMLKNIFQTTPHLYIKVNIFYTLGNLYVLQGCTQEVKECFAYALKNGNKLYLTTKAKELLEKLESLA